MGKKKEEQITDYIELARRLEHHISSFSKKNDLTKSETVLLLENIKPEVQKADIPVSVFSQKLGSLETICKYLKEDLHLSYAQIGRLLNRNERTVWATYARAKKKSPKPLLKKKTPYFIPSDIINSRKLSVLESITLYLKRTYHLTFSQIGKILSRDPRNIRTVYERALKKGGARK